MTTQRSEFGTALNARRRAQDIEYLQSDPEDIDMIVIGGGITGVGVALDAVTRGLNVVLLEKHDLGFGTSRFSSKLAHGGLRYLAKLEVGIAYHSACERGILMEVNAPHLIHKLPQVTILGADTNIVQKALIRMGYLAGDMLRIAARTSSKTLPRSRFANKQRTLELVPTASREKLVGSWVNFDGQMVDDARIVTAVARTAAGEGARILTYTAVDSATGEVVTLTDTLSGKSMTVKAKCVVNATGVWAGGLDKDIKIRPSRGTHIILDSELFGNPTGALTVPLPGSFSRYLFILPEQLGRVFIGLTDEETPGEIPDVPPTPEEDIQFIIENINRALDKKISRKDVIGAFTGLRPLIDQGGNAGTADVSRRHSTIEADNGLISIVGGKYTEFRLMAEEIVDEVLSRRNLPASGCVTRNFPYVGARAHREFRDVRPEQLHGLPQSLVERYGYEAPTVVEAATLSQPLAKVAGLDITRAEFEYAVTHEGALTEGDILDRRTRVGLVEKDRVAAAPVAREVLQLHNLG
ncbi:Aerobic glycerol-3-phosphate dehydrogenase [Corynebacterium kalinowskii]|uniref:Glycerol-3-phosphate dehydrogenase n=1 Tax=Corynebacterium kalinowskii TaxID=2675216 RepID=A0A6B8VW05_9CORY|nr:glycerol-3-phosphate dehydrogenase/oxidase [Corynebacterium kalinowskii]QGU02866.1 Aerobic glycerol-3-phosphate dehydrogenase [Corynebacterium kalinowskii]